jgi:hypothetical protein
MASPTHRRPDGTDDATVEAVGKVSEAFEWVERARGSLYEFHHKMGHADLLFAEAADALDAAGHPDEAAAVRRGIVGRDALAGRWSFESVEEFDDVYHAAAKKAAADVRNALMGGRPHVFEAEMKADRQADPRNAG